MALLVALGLICLPTEAQDGGVIRLRSKPSSDGPISLAPTSAPDSVDSRRGFDHAGFEARLESLWFQRKAFLADGRDDDAKEQSRLIEAFCREEGIHRLENLASALISEAHRFAEEGQTERAVDSLQLAEALDPGRSQVHFARAAVLRQADGGALAAITQWAAGARAVIGNSIQDLTLFNRLALVLVWSVGALVGLFSLLMVWRHHVAFRHEVEEIVVGMADERLARPAGWAVLTAPVLLWFTTGWAPLIWIAATFRFMTRSERATATVLICASILGVPSYRVAVTVYGMTVDPVVRSTLAASDGEYDPDRVLELRKLVAADPEDPAYRFLLAGLYKNGRFFEEAFAEYKLALQLEPEMHQAYINIGNIFYTTGQFPEAIAQYTQSIELRPQSMVGLFNLHLAQSESFQFDEAEDTLARAREIDADRLADMLSIPDGFDRPIVIDAKLQTTSLWGAALQGREPTPGSTGEVNAAGFGQRVLNPISIGSILTLAVCGLLMLTTLRNAPARPCIRCGRPFCHFCKSNREAHEYCSQCLHLFVLGDGLAPETKTRKLYEVGRHEVRKRRGRRIVSLILPGAGQLLRGNSVRGTVILLVWIASLIAWRPDLFAAAEGFIGADSGLELLWSSGVPARSNIQALTVLAFVSATIAWIAGNSGMLRRGREA